MADKNMQKWYDAMGVYFVPQQQVVQITPMDTARMLADKAGTLAELQEAVMNFSGCPLKENAINTVFSDGMPSAKVMLIGEAPGAEEDKQGIPFCGESGQLLDNILASIGLSRKSNCYISNTVFWRPPANRAPTHEEVSICLPFVQKHIALMKPKLLLLVGGVATQNLLGKEFQISKVQRQIFKYSNCYLTEPIDVMCVYHPAYLLRQPMQKKVAWYSFLEVKKFLSHL